MLINFLQTSKIGTRNRCTFVFSNSCYTLEDEHGTWEYSPGKRNIIFQFTILRFYVNLRGCRWNYWIWIWTWNIVFVFFIPQLQLFCAQHRRWCSCQARWSQHCLWDGKMKECTKRTKAWLDLGFGILSLSMCFFLKIIQIEIICVGFCWYFESIES